MSNPKISTVMSLDRLTVNPPAEFAIADQDGYDSKFCGNATLTWSKTTLGLHTVGGGNEPTIAAGAGAGTGPTVALGAGSTDTTGQVTVTTGSTPGASGVVATLTFDKAYDTAPYVQLTPANAATAALGSAACFPAATADGFTINSNAAALTADTNYVWNYSTKQQ